MLADVSALLADDEPMRGYGAAVTRGSDGLCVFVAGYGCRNRLLAWRDGAVVDVATEAVRDPRRHALGVAAADLDADGREELYVHASDAFSGMGEEPDLLLSPDAPADSSPPWRNLFGLAANAERVDLFAGRSVAAVDRYGTGRYGMVVTGYDAPTRFYELGDDGELTDMAPAVGLDEEFGGRSLLSAPILSERMDLFVGVENGPNRLYRNTGGHFEDVAGQTGVADPDEDARGVALVDAGDPDRPGVACGVWEGPSRLYLPDGEGFYDAAPPELADPTRMRTLVAADLDNDGRQELFCNAFGAPNRLFRPDDGGWQAVDIGEALEPAGLGTGAVVADLDGDGVLELLVVHGEVAPQPLSLYRAADADGDWLRVAPTTHYGAPARGARVVLETTAGVQSRVVDAGQGYLCQMEPVAHFGLGDAEPLRVTVRWPDGREATVEEPEPCRELAPAHPRAPRF